MAPQIVGLFQNCAFYPLPSARNRPLRWMGPGPKLDRRRSIGAHRCPILHSARKSPRRRWGWAHRGAGPWFEAFEPGFRLAADPPRNFFEIEFLTFSSRSRSSGVALVPRWPRGSVAVLRVRIPRVQHVYFSGAERSPSTGRPPTVAMRAASAAW